MIFKNIALLPAVLIQIFEEAFGLRQMAAGGFGAALKTVFNMITIIPMAPKAVCSLNDYMANCKK